MDMDKRKILIVDDDADVRRGLSIRLRANDYETVYASDAIQAVSTAKKERPDVILLDLGLPGGDGFVVMERLRHLQQMEDTPIIVISGRDPAVNRERALQAGAQAFFQKPVDNEDLLGAIQAALLNR
jgi:DNA-binding response OmpR family regulator